MNFQIHSKHFLRTKNQWVLFGAIDEGILTAGMFIRVDPGNEKIKINSVEIATIRGQGMLGIIIDETYNDKVKDLTENDRLQVLTN